MGEFIDDDDGWAARKGGVEVEFVIGLARMLALAPWQHLQPVEQAGCFAPPMRLGQAHHDVGAGGPALLGPRKHGIGLAHARRRTEEDRQLAAAFACGKLEQGPGIGAPLVPGVAHSVSTGFQIVQRQVEF
ncbi:hypothetical protein D3C72_2038490 [compost metagenome]